MSDPTPTNDQLRASWDALAWFWDDQMEAGSTWQRHLIQPALERLLEIRTGEQVLEIACGNGEFARRMAELGASVLATDFSAGMLERARAKGGGIAYRLADATDESELLALGEVASFDAVVRNMALMDRPRSSRSRRHRPGSCASGGDSSSRSAIRRSTPGRWSDRAGLRGR